MNFPNSVRFSKLKKLHPEAHWEACKSEGASIKYVMKEETRKEGPYEFGTLPVRQNNKKDWNEVWELAKTNQIEKIDKSVLVPHYKTIKQIAVDHMSFQRSDTLKGIWYYGASGTGKSRKAWTDHPQAYPKECNKWWDGYKGQDTVIMDDLVPERAAMLYDKLLKWTDHYPCTLEVKGSTVPNNYSTFIVTSNYSIDQCFATLPPESLVAMKRRFKVTHFNSL